MLLVKESLGPTVAAFGIYAVLATRRWLLGGALALGSVAFFWIVILPRSSGLFTTIAAGGGGESYGYLGPGILEILRTIVTSPDVWLFEIGGLSKLKFLFLMSAPLMFLPLLAPAVLLVAVPGLLMALLSRHPHRYPDLDAVHGTSHSAPVRGHNLRRATVRWVPWRWASAMASDRRGPPVVDARHGDLLQRSLQPFPFLDSIWLGQPDWLRWFYHFRAYLVTT